eukprot:6472272-Amphidinium_carterae.3
MLHGTHACLGLRWTSEYVRGFMHWLEVKAHAPCSVISVLGGFLEHEALATTSCPWFQWCVCVKT